MRKSIEVVTNPRDDPSFITCDDQILKKLPIVGEGCCWFVTQLVRIHRHPPGLWLVALYARVRLTRGQWCKPAERECTCAEMPGGARICTEATFLSCPRLLTFAPRGGARVASSCNSLRFVTRCQPKQCRPGYLLMRDFMPMSPEKNKAVHESRPSFLPTASLDRGIRNVIQRWQTISRGRAGLDV